MSFHGNYKSSINSPNKLLTTPNRPTISRYSLSNSWTGTPPSQEKRKSFSANLSTQIDSNSPGYSSRLVHYNEEQERSTPKRNNRYDKLGVFPIVHFFKKDLPVLKRKSSPRNSSDLSKYNTPEQNRMLLETIIKSTPESPYANSYKNETNTKSVLDALKEISRKRIHANRDDLIVKEDGKRSYVDYENEPPARKRLKQNCMQFEGGSPKPVLKSGPMNEVTASLSSMMGYFSPNPPQPEPPKRPVQTETPLKPVATPTISVNVQTQTPPPPKPTVSQPVATVSMPKADVASVSVPWEQKPKRGSPIQIFDDKPLEEIRRKRLALLLGTPFPETPQDSKPSEESQTEDSPKADKPLVSILSGSGKSPNKVAKHVTFDIPEGNGHGADSNVTKPPLGTDMVTKTSAAVVMPIVSAAVVESISPPKSVAAPKVEMPVSLTFGSQLSSPQKDTSVTAAALASPIVIGHIGSPTNNVPKTTASAPIQSGGFRFELKEQSFTEAPKSVPFSLLTSTPSLSTAVTSSGPNLSQAPVSKASSLGFASKIPEMANGNTPSLGIQFGPPPTGSFGINKTQSSVGPIVSPSQQSFANKMSTPNFAIPATSNSTVLFNFGSNTNTNPSGTALGASSVNSPSGAFSSTNTLTTSSGFNTTTTVSSAPFNFGAPPNQSPFSNPTKTPGILNTSKPISLGPPPSKPTSETFFGSSTNALAKTPAFGSGNNTPSFGSDSKTSLFGPNTNGSFGTATPSFGTTNNSAPKTSTSFGTAKPTFGSASTNPVPNTNTFGTTAPSFGSANNPAPNTNTFGTTAPSFGITNSPAPNTNSFGTTALNFGSTNNPAPNTNTFGTTTPTFGSTNNPAPNTNTFGSTTPSFGSTNNPAPNTNSAFGTTAPSFGSTNNPAQKTNSSFGTTTPSFGSTNNSAPNTNNTFGTTIPSFGNTNNPAPNTNSTFGTTTPSFGNTNNPAPNTNNTFGTTTSSFGSTNNAVPTKNTFGNVAPAQNNVFGNTNFNKPPEVSSPANAVNFGSTNFAPPQKASFPNGSTSSTFNQPFGPAGGATSPPFGASNSTPFGTTKPSFGTTSNTFSSTTQMNPTSSSTFSSFGKSDPPTTTAAAPFGNPAPSFSSNQFPGAAQPSQNNLFTFGSTEANKPGVFSFGGSKPPEPSFNFQAQNNTAMSNANSAIFGAAGTSSNTLAVPQFNVQQPGGGMFNIGTGGAPASAVGRFRGPHKGKRRT